MRNELVEAGFSPDKTEIYRNDASVTVAIAIKDQS